MTPLRSRQSPEQDDFCCASEVMVAVGQFRGVGPRRHQGILSAMKVQNLHAGLCERSKVIYRVEFASATVEFLKRQAVIQSLRRTRDDVGQGWISAEVRRRTHSRDPVNARRMAKRPTIRDQATVAVRQDPSPLVQTMLGDELFVEFLADFRRGGAATGRSDIDARY